MRLSASQITTVQRCMREWAFKYILQIKDTTVSPALTIGKAFHKLCEGSAVGAEDFQGLDVNYPWVHYLKTMYAGYRQVRKEFAPAVAHEIVYEDERMKMYIDEIAVDDTGAWWMIERKTKAKDLPTAKSMIVNELQANIYVSNYENIADDYMLDPSQFQGLLYFTTFKPMERKGKKETPEDFGARMTSETIAWTIPRIYFINDQSTATLNNVIDWAEISCGQAMSLWERNQNYEDIPISTQSCYRYNRPCPYFEKCHAKPDDVYY